MKRMIIQVVSLLVFAVVASGCGEISFEGDDGETTTINYEDAKDGKMNIEVEDKDGNKGGMNIDTDEDGNTEMQMDTEDGEFDMKAGEGTEIPEGFPNDFPIPNNAQIEMVNTMTEDEHIMYMIHFTFSGSAKEIYEKVKAYALEKGLETVVDSKTETEDKHSYMYNAKGNEDGHLTFNINSEEDALAQVHYRVQK